MKLRRQQYYNDNDDSSIASQAALASMESLLNIANSNLRGPLNDRQAPQTQQDLEQYPPQPPPSNERPWQQLYCATHPRNVDQYIDDDDETENNALYELCELCALAGQLEMNVRYGDDDHEEHNSSWNPVRFWIQAHTKEEWKASLEVPDEDGKTALHIACQHQPPLDVMDTLLHADSFTSKLLEVQDVFGWTPLHYLCALSAPPDVVQLIAEMCSEAKLLVTNKGLTPLHLAVIGPFRDYPDLIATLASTGASRKVDKQGLLPLHYACAFGASEESLLLLIDCYSEALTARDNLGRNPLHFAVANATTAPKAAPVTVRLLLKMEPTLVNPPTEDEGLDPFLFLLDYVTAISARSSSDELRESIKKCLIMLLDAKPNPTPTVLAALRGLPYWLFPTAILSSTVKDMLNEKIKGRFPTLILMLDFYMQVLVIVCYHSTVSDSIYRRSGESSDVSIPGKMLIPLYIGATYFLLRELVLVLALIWLMSLRTFIRLWVFHSSDLLNFSYIFLVYFLASVMNSGYTGMLAHDTSRDIFRFVAVISAFVLWLKLFIFLKSLSIDFSVFVAGTFHVARRLFPYMCCVMCFVTAFAQIFHTLFLSNDDYDYADCSEETITVVDMQCGHYDHVKPFCTYRGSFLRVCTMFLGEVNDDDFPSRASKVVFGFFMLMMVILFANVLIAIVTDYYKVIQDKEAALVFYTNRLYFLAETDALGNFPCFRLTPHSISNSVDAWAGETWKELWHSFKMGSTETETASNRAYSNCARPSLVGSCENDQHDEGREDGTSSPPWSDELWTYKLFLAISAAIIIPCWFVLGVVTCGAVWPPQIRKWLFGSNKVKRSLAAQREVDLQIYRREEEAKLETEVIETRESFREGLAGNRQQYAQIKASILERKQGIRKEMKHIRVVMENLFEQAEQAGADREYDSDG